MSSKQQQIHTAVVFEIDSASVAVAVVDYQKGSDMPIREHFSKRVDIDSNVSFEDFFVRTVKVFEGLAREALRDSSVQIESIYVSLSVPWMSSQKRVAHYSKEKPFIFTEELADQIIKKELAEPLSKNLDFHKHGDLSVFERRTTDIYVHGYPTLKPFDSHKEVTDVDIHSLSSVVSETTRETFEHVIERVFHRKPKFISNAFVLYQAVRNFIPNENSAVVMDMGGTNTEMYVIDHDHLRSIASFPVGREHLVEHLAGLGHVSLQKARSLLRLYTQESLEEKYEESLSGMMDEVYRQWMKPWYSLCDELSAKKLLPSTICLVAPDDISSWLRYHVLKTDELTEHVHSQKMPQVIELPILLQAQADEINAAHLSDMQMVPVIDVVAKLIAY